MGKTKWVVAVLVAALAVYYWTSTRNRCVFSGDVKLHGKTVIITGGNSGVGKETALDLARRGARVILACRNLQKAEEAAKEIKTRTGNSEVVVRHLELSSLQSVREFAKRINESEERLDILINNAGIAVDAEGSVTADNFHTVFGINHFGHFLLTNLLLDLLKKSAPSRVVTVSSQAHTHANENVGDLVRLDPEGASGVFYPRLKDYQTSKMANVLFARELDRRAGPAGVVSVSLHPGVVFTPIWEKSARSSRPIVLTIYHWISPLLRLFFIDEKAGAQTTIHCALDESVVELSGGYFDNCAAVEPSSPAQDDQLAEKLWEVSCEATGLTC